jgi:(2Fe-2S) ferredoxin
MSPPKTRLPVAVLLGKSAIAAAPGAEMARWAQQLEATGRVSSAVYAFSEQGTPALRDVVHQLRDEGVEEILILPTLIPMEPAFHAWILRTVQRWHLEAGGRWPVIRVGRGLAEAQDLTPILSEMMDSALASPAAAPNAKAGNEGSVVSDVAHSVLVCQGGPCNQMGAAVVWGHLRNAQVRLKLAECNGGMRSAKTSCLGPCGLAPVVQVYPDGVLYGGVDEAGMDRIIHEHLRHGQIVEDLAYRPQEGKQRLRPPRPPIAAE